YDHALEVASHLRARRLPISLEISGRADSGQWLQRNIAERGLQDVVHYHGEAQSGSAFLRTGDVFLLMSRLEGVPNALLEAMNLGLPCIATKVGDIPRMTNDTVNIRLVNVGDVLAVVQILEEMLQRWSLARDLGEAARRLCQERFTPQ